MKTIGTLFILLMLTLVVSLYWGMYGEEFGTALSIIFGAPIAATMFYHLDEAYYQNRGY